jgi:hypothetical protein
MTRFRLSALSTILFAVLLYRWSRSCKSDNAGVSLADKMRLRTVKTVVLSRWQSEGKGARVRRSIGRPELRSVYLLFDQWFPSQSALKEEI